MSNGTTNGSKANTIIDLLKTILASQVGGWILACVAFALVSYWTIQDRQMVYAENMRIRGEAMITIKDVQTLIHQAADRAMENNKMIRDAQSVTEDNNAMLREIRSMMNIPMANRQTLENIKEQLKKENAPQ